MKTIGYRLGIGLLSLPMVAASCAAPRPDYDATIQQAEQRLEAGDVPAAWESATRARQIDELRPEAYRVLVRLGRDHELCAEAIPLFERRVELGGDDVARYHYFLGLLQADCDRRRDAEEHLRLAIEMEPRSAAAYLELAGLLGSEGRFEEAIELLAEAAPRFTHRPAIPTLQGELLVKRRRWREAEDVLAETLQHHPSHARARFMLALALIHQEKLERARAELERTVETRPDYAVGWYQLAHVYDRLGEPALRQRALARFSEAYRQHGAAI